MAKQFKDWLDDFTNNGFNAQDITNWPEEGGGGSGEPAEVTELPDHSNTPENGVALHIEGTPENEVYWTISSGTYMELPGELGELLPPMQAIENLEEDVTIYENAELNAGAVIYYDSSFSTWTYSSNVVDYLNDQEREPDPSLIDDYDVAYFRTPYYNVSSGQWDSIYSSGYGYLIPVKQTVQGQEESVDPTNEGLVLSSGTIRSIDIFVPVNYSITASPYEVDVATAAEFDVGANGEDLVKILDVIVFGDDHGEPTLPPEAFNIEYGTMSSGEYIYYPQAQSSGARSFNYTSNPFIALINEMPSESGDPLNPWLYGSNGYNMTPLEIDHTYKVVRDDSTGGCWIEEDPGVDIDTVPALKTFIQDTTREEGFDSVIYYPYFYSSGQRYYGYYEPNTNADDQSYLFLANSSESGTGYQDSWNVYPIYDGSSRLSNDNIVKVLNIAKGYDRYSLGTNWYNYDSSKKAFVPLYDNNVYSYAYSPVTIEPGKAYYYSFPTNNSADFQPMSENYIYYNDANGNVNYSQLPASGTSVTVTINGVEYTISRS